MLLAEIPQATVERVARVYKTNTDAAKALGVNEVSFNKLCRRYQIETPYARGQRLRAERRISC